MAVLVALVALALFSCVDAQFPSADARFPFRLPLGVAPRLDRLRGRVNSALESLSGLVDDEDLGEGVDPTLENLSELVDEADLESVATEFDQLRVRVESALENLSGLAVEEDQGSIAAELPSIREDLVSDVRMVVEDLYSECQFLPSQELPVNIYNPLSRICSTLFGR